jgi:hypothetical protein
MLKNMAAFTNALIFSVLMLSVNNSHDMSARLGEQSGDCQSYAWLRCACDDNFVHG